VDKQQVLRELLRKAHAAEVCCAKGVHCWSADMHCLDHAATVKGTWCSSALVRCLDHAANTASLCP
jgi:hypothetical protein